MPLTDIYRVLFLSLKEKKKDTYIQRAINFTPEQFDKAQKYVKVQKKVIPGYNFTALVRESLDYFLDFYAGDEGLEAIIKVIDKRIETKDYQKLLQRVLFKFYEQIYFDPRFDEPDFTPPKFETIDKFMEEFQKIIRFDLEEEE